MTPRDGAACLARHRKGPLPGTTYGRVLGPPIGVMLPSSNQIVERVTEDVLGLIPGVHACYARVPYWGRGKGQPDNGYDKETLLAAAELLSHTEPAVLVWNATRGSAFGFDLDRNLCRDIERRFGIPVSTTSLAALEALRGFAVRRIAMVTVGSARYVDRMVENFADAGIETAALHNFGEMDNARQAEVDTAPIAEFACNAARQARTEAILIWSTNLPGHGMAADIERQTGIPVFDSAALGIWAGLSILRQDTSAAAGRGRLFAGS